MREILFRGKRTDNGKFIYGFLVMNKCSTSENGRLIYYTRPEIIPVGEIGEADYDGDGNYYEYTVIPETVGQYTGLTDKNDKHIFEGDIVIDNDGFGKDLYVVRHNAYLCGFSRFNPRIKLFSGTIGSLSRDEVEVIGNIHDNPEILKGAESDA